MASSALYVLVHHEDRQSWALGHAQAAAYALLLHHPGTVVDVGERRDGAEGAGIGAGIAGDLLEALDDGETPRARAAPRGGAPRARSAAAGTPVCVSIGLPPYPARRQMPSRIFWPMGPQRSSRNSSR